MSLWRARNNQARASGPPAGVSPHSWALRVAGFVAAATLIAGGRPSSWMPVGFAGAAAPEAAPEERARAVTMWVPARGGYLPLWRKAAELAGTMEGGVSIDVEPRWADYGAALTLALAEGTGPDLAVVDPSLVARLASRGWIEPIVLDDALAPPSPAAEAFTWRGRLFAVPGPEDPVLLYANAATLREAGEAPPDGGWDWQRLLQASRRVVGARLAPWGMGVNGWPPLVMFVWQAGGGVLEAPCEPWSNPEAVVAAASYYRRWITESLSPPPPDSWHDPPDALFRRAQAAFVMGLASDPLDTAGFDVAVAPPPAGPASQATWLWLEGAVAVRPASHRAMAALAALAQAIGHMGRGAFVEVRPAARAAGLAALAHARALPPSASFLEFDAEWWRRIVSPILQSPEPLDLRDLLARALPHLRRALSATSPPSCPDAPGSPKR